MAQATPTRPPVVLIVGDHEWSSRSLESILAPSGFAVMRAYTGRKGLERAQAHAPDVVISDITLPDFDGLEFCRMLRSNTLLGDRTPILISSPERLVRHQRLAALEAGAWEVIAYPVDVEDLVLRLRAYVRAKFESDRFQEGGLVDDPTGLYNLRGIQRRAEELSNLAYRAKNALACVVIGPAAELDEPDIARLVRAIANAIRSTGRTSDAIGRLGASEFAVVAPTTDSVGAKRLAERLVDASRRAARDARIELRAGFDAVDNAREDPAAARELLRNAVLALRRARASGNGASITAFRETEPAR
jgi:PleD family two-component response regulator